jgi:hypothetical protein
MTRKEERLRANRRPEVEALFVRPGSPDNPQKRRVKGHQTTWKKKFFQ